MKPIEPLLEEEEDEDELNGLSDEKAPRVIGVFIKHEDFNVDNVDAEDGKDQHKDLTPIEQVFVMDHDFVCVQKQRNEEFEANYEKGLIAYLTGDWIGAHSLFNHCADKL